MVAGWLTGEVQAQNLAQRDYEYCSAGQVHRWSDMPGSWPLYDSILVVENYPVDATVLPFGDTGIDVSDYRSLGAQTRHALTLLVHPGAELEIRIIYSRERFAEDAAAHIAAHLRTLIESIITAPYQSLPQLTASIPVDTIPHVRPTPEHGHAGMAAAFVAPRSLMELQLARIWQEVLHLPMVGVRDNFFDLGGHSLIAVELIARIRQQTGHALSLATLLQAGTVEALAAVLSQHETSAAWCPLVAIQPHGSRRPFFCVPGTGGNVLYFYDLARHLGPEQPFYGLQALGLDGMSAPLTSIEVMATQYVQAIQSVQPHGPYLLGGHSFGSYVAFEMAQQLLKQGQGVALLAIFDTTALFPSQRSERRDWNEAQWLMDIVGLYERFFGKNLQVSYEDLQRLEPDEQLHYLNERLKGHNLLPPEALTSQLHGFLQVTKAHNRVHYQPREPLPTHIALFRATVVQADDIAEDLELAEMLREPHWGWGRYARGPVVIHDVAGDHITMMTEPHVQVLAERLRTCLSSLTLR
jgi:thioesterase domain-containing protein